MGKIRAVTLGDEENEKEQKRRAEARRATKQSKKAKVDGVGLGGGERVSVPEESDLKPEYKKLVEDVEHPEVEGKKKEKPVRGPRVRGKKYLEVKAKVDKKTLYPVVEAVKLVKETSFSRFDGTVELHVALQSHALTENGDYRGSVSLPHGTGKTIRVVVADEATVAKVEAGTIDFDILVAHPSLMPKLAKVAKILGPKGLMPNPKNGTVSPDPEKRAKELAGGSVNFKTEPNNPLVHLSIGKVSFDTDKLVDNIQAVFGAIGRTKISRATLSSTMGPGVKIQVG